MADRPPMTISEQQEAGPLPPKRGEIGYREDIHGRGVDNPSDDIQPLPSRHPADRDPPPESTPPSHDPVNPGPSLTSSPATTTTTTTTHNSSNNTGDNSSTHKCDKVCLISFFKCGQGPTYFGVQLSTLLLFALQLVFFSATIVVWVFTGLHFSRRMSNQADRASSTPPPPNNASGPLVVIIHIIFTLLVLAQLIFIERRIFCIRAERLMHHHPGDVMGASSRRGSTMSMPIAPWNRPALPTYAATLVQSGVGTGDVEDHLIAAPPPPAYGNTRGSTLLLASALRESLRASQGQQHRRSGTLESQRIGAPDSRPVSYHTTDGERETRRDADRTRQLEETLSTLERSLSRSRRDEVV